MPQLILFNAACLVLFCSIYAQHGNLIPEYMWQLSPYGWVLLCWKSVWMTKCNNCHRNKKIWYRYYSIYTSTYIILTLKCLAVLTSLQYKNNKYIYSTGHTCGIQVDSILYYIWIPHSMPTCLRVHLPAGASACLCLLSVIHLL